MANTNYAIKLYKTSDSAKRVGINVTNSTDTTDYALYVNGNTKIAGDAEITNSLIVNDLTISDTGFINSSNINVDKRNNYSDPGNIWFIVGDSSSREGGGLISISEQTSSNKKVPSTLNFYIRSYSNGTMSNYGELYSLPIVNSELSSTQYYNILTSKNAVTVAQGGTGRTTLTSNAILAGNGTSSIKMIATAKGAAYATAENGALTFGTLPIAQGGTGANTAANARSRLGITPANIGAATSSHTHGNITNAGDITATAPTIANGDQIIINDNSESKITNGPTFDGSTTTQCLTKKGTWETFIKGSGTSGYLAKWNGGSNITNGPQLGSNTTTFLLNNGTWSNGVTGPITFENGFKIQKIQANFVYAGSSTGDMVNFLNSRSWNCSDSGLWIISDSGGILMGTGLVSFTAYATETNVGYGWLIVSSVQGIRGQYQLADGAWTYYGYQ